MSANVDLNDRPDYDRVLPRKFLLVQMVFCISRIVYVFRMWMD